MGRAIDETVTGAALPRQAFAGGTTADRAGSPPIAELVAAAAARLRRDLEAFHPNRPTIASALAWESHTVMMQHWREYSAEAQMALLTALHEDATGLLRQLQADSARIVPANGFMFGLQDEAIKLEAQTDITLEEIRRIEAEQRALETGEPPQ